MSDDTAIIWLTLNTSAHDIESVERLANEAQQIVRQARILEGLGWTVEYQTHDKEWTDFQAKKDCSLAQAKLDWKRMGGGRVMDYGDESGVLE